MVFKKVADNVKAANTGTMHTVIVKTDDTIWVAGINVTGEIGGGARYSWNVFEKAVLP